MLSLKPVDVDKETVKHATWIGIYIIPNAGLKNITARQLNCAFLMSVQHHGAGDALPTDKPLGEFQQMLMEFQGLFGKPTYTNLQNERKVNFKIKTERNCKVQFHSPYGISLWEEIEYCRLLTHAMCWG